MLAAILWDVTDRDIDIFAQLTFNKLRLNFDEVKALKACTLNCTPVSVITMVVRILDGWQRFLPISFAVGARCSVKERGESNLIIQLDN